jgi:hypothetical protein
MFTRTRTVLLVEENGVPEGNHRPAANHLQTLSHNVALHTIEAITLTITSPMYFHMFVYMTNRQSIPCWEISIKRGAYAFYYCLLFNAIFYNSSVTPMSRTSI